MNLFLFLSIIGVALCEFIVEDTSAVRPIIPVNPGGDAFHVDPRDGVSHPMRTERTYGEPEYAKMFQHLTIDLTKLSSSYLINGSNLFPYDGIEFIFHSPEGSKITANCTIFDANHAENVFSDGFSVSQSGDSDDDAFRTSYGNGNMVMTSISNSLIINFFPKSRISFRDHCQVTLMPQTPPTTTITPPSTTPTAAPSTTEFTTPNPPTTEFTTPEPATSESTTSTPTTTESTTTTTSTTESTTPEPATTESTTPEPATTESTTPEPATTESTPPATTQPAPTNCTCGARKRPARIMNGETAARNEFPWRCSLQKGIETPTCGATLISPNYILTSGYCCGTFNVKKENITVGCGSHDVRSFNEAPTVIIKVEKKIRHPKYSAKGGVREHDICLMRLSSPMQYSSEISPACLPFNNCGNQCKGKNVPVVTSGWGAKRHEGKAGTILQKVDLPCISSKKCQKYHRTPITENMICTYKNGFDACTGDEGGSIDFAGPNGYCAIGVVSFNYGCGEPNQPGIHTNVAKYLPWIQETTGERFCGDGK